MGGEPLSSTPDVELGKLTATSPHDVWALGFQDDGSGNHSAWAEHFDGSSWTPEPVPGAGPTMRSVLAQGVSIAPADVWASGTASDANVDRAIMRHWNGGSWSSVSLPSEGYSSRSMSVVANGPHDVWLTGLRRESALGHTRAFMQHWNGSAWSRSPLPAMCGGQSGIYGLAAIASHDVWGVGQCGGTPDALTVHWNGSAWSQVPVPMPPGAAAGFLDAVDAVSPTSAWAVGTYTNQTGGYPLIEHWNGSAWKVVPGADVIRAGNYDTAFDDVEVVSPGDVWAVGNTGGKAITEHWDGASWSAVAGVNLFDEQNLDDVLSLPGGRLWTVGNNRFATGQLFQQLTEAPVVDGTGPPTESIRGTFGRPIAWRFPGKNHRKHSVTDVSGLRLFDSGLRAHGRSFVYRFTAAGAYWVKDKTTSHRERITIPVVVRPSGMRITVRIASGPAPKGYVYDVQVRKPGGSSFVPLASGLTGAKYAKTFSQHGTFAFRARLRRSGSAHHSGWSPAGSAVI